MEVGIFPIGHPASRLLGALELEEEKLPEPERGIRRESAEESHVHGGLLLHRYRRSDSAGRDVRRRSHASELREWEYGTYEGLTTGEIREQDPGWVLWHDGAPGGESPDDVAARVDRLVEELCDPCRDGGDVLLFGHGHSLRAVAVRWIGLPIAAGRLLRLGTGTLSELGWKREFRVIDVWNDGSHLRRGP